jgi:cytochrome c oxidase cbb3-type subunit 4
MTHESITQIVGIGGSIYFMLLFAGVLIYALNPKAKDTFDHAAQIPLREDDLDD